MVLTWSSLVALNTAGPEVSVLPLIQPYIHALCPPCRRHAWNEELANPGPASTDRHLRCGAVLRARAALTSSSKVQRARLTRSRRTESASSQVSGRYRCLACSAPRLHPAARLVRPALEQLQQRASITPDGASVQRGASVPARRRRGARGWSDARRRAGAALACCPTVAPQAQEGKAGGVSRRTSRVARHQAYAQRIAAVNQRRSERSWPMSSISSMFVAAALRDRDVAIARRAPRLARSRSRSRAGAADGIALAVQDRAGDHSPAAAARAGTGPGVAPPGGIGRQLITDHLVGRPHPRWIHSVDRAAVASGPWNRCWSSIEALTVKRPG